MFLPRCDPSGWEECQPGEGAEREEMKRLRDGPSATGGQGHSRPKKLELNNQKIIGFQFVAK